METAPRRYRRISPARRWAGERIQIIVALIALLIFATITTVVTMNAIDNGACEEVTSYTDPMWRACNAEAGR